jgi:hypothetical protein
MIGYYLGMALMTVISVLCLREAHTQWRRANTLEQNDSASSTVHEARGWAIACLLASGAFALIDIIAGGIVWACTG